jgi:CheY-like chemotaxis protein
MGAVGARVADRGTSVEVMRGMSDPHQTTPAATGVILLASRDSDWRYILGTMLRERGLEVAELDDLDRVEEVAVDAAVVVTNYPNVTGDRRTVTERLRSDPRTASIPILNATTHAMPHELAEADRAGVSRSVVLPVSMDVLVNSIHELMHSRRRPSPAARDDKASPVV